MKRKGFTLVELLVVIAIIALLMGILMPALAKVRQLAFRLVCGTNLSGIGKAMMIYANDYEDKFPKAGRKKPLWVRELGAPAWSTEARQNAFSVASTTDSYDSRATITSCFYLLVKYAEVTPESFLCKGDSGVSEFKLKEEGLGTGYELIDVWDFGSDPQEHCSYAYHFPFDIYASTTSSDPGMALAADPNPWVTSDAREGRDEDDWSDFASAAGNVNASSEMLRKGNALTHQEEGQNVLFLDSHVEFTKKTTVGIDDENIYTHWYNGDRFAGNGPTNTHPSESQRSRNDSFLVNDGKSSCGAVAGTAYSDPGSGIH